MLLLKIIKQLIILLASPDIESFFRAYFPDANIKSLESDKLDLLEEFEKRSSNALMDEKKFQKILKQIQGVNSQNEQKLKSDVSSLNLINDRGVIENFYFTNSFNLIHFSKQISFFDFIF